MAWKRYQVSNGHNTLDNEELEPDAVSWVLSRLKTHFGLRLQGGPGLEWTSPLPLVKSGLTMPQSRLAGITGAAFFSWRMMTMATLFYMKSNCDSILGR